jgi:hypothetical protein
MVVTTRWTERFPGVVMMAEWRGPSSGDGDGIGGGWGGGSMVPTTLKAVRVVAAWTKWRRRGAGNFGSLTTSKSKSSV